MFSKCFILHVTTVLKTSNSVSATLILWTCRNKSNHINSFLVLHYADYIAVIQWRSKVVRGAGSTVFKITLARQLGGPVKTLQQTPNKTGRAFAIV